MNLDADALSRKPLQNLGECEKECLNVVTMDHLDKVMSVNSQSEPPKCAETVDVSVLELREEIEESAERRSCTCTSMQACCRKTKTI